MVHWNYCKRYGNNDWNRHSAQLSHSRSRQTMRSVVNSGANHPIWDANIYFCFLIVLLCATSTMALQHTIVICLLKYTLSHRSTLTFSLFSFSLSLSLYFCAISILVAQIFMRIKSIGKNIGNIFVMLQYDCLYSILYNETNHTTSCLFSLRELEHAL